MRPFLSFPLFCWQGCIWYLGEHEEVSDGGDDEPESGEEDDEPDEVVAACRVLGLEDHDWGDQSTKKEKNYHNVRQMRKHL